MANPMNLLASLEAPMATNGRGSGDYASGYNWDIGPGSLLWHALDLRPSKDNFWTEAAAEPLAPGQKPYGDPRLRNAGTFNAAVALLSTGPVGVSDRAGYTNATIVMHTCNARGDLLQPNRPATAIDRTFATPSSVHTPGAPFSCGEATAFPRYPAAVMRCGRINTAPSGPEGMPDNFVAMAIDLDNAGVGAVPLYRTDLYPRPPAGSEYVAARGQHSTAPSKRAAIFLDRGLVGTHTAPTPHPHRTRALGGDVSLCAAKQKQILVSHSIKMARPPATIH